MPRTIAIGDIHGCSLALDALLAAIAPRADDVLIPLGDYIDRGPDSRGVLDRLIELEGRCRLAPILGNHDQMLLDVRSGKYPLYWLLDIGGVETLKSYGDLDPSPKSDPDSRSLRRSTLRHPRLDLDLIPESHFDFLGRCLDFFETETHIFTHANYYPDLAMDEQPAAMLRWESLREATPGPHDSGKTAIVGHTSQKGGEVLDLGHLICIDTFCYGGGWLTALDVNSGRVWQADERGRLRA